MKKRVRTESEPSPSESEWKSFLWRTDGRASPNRVRTSPNGNHFYGEQMKERKHKISTKIDRRLARHWNIVSREMRGAQHNWCNSLHTNGPVWNHGDPVQCCPFGLGLSLPYINIYAKRGGSPNWSNLYGKRIRPRVQSESKASPNESKCGAYLW